MGELELEVKVREYIKEAVPDWEEAEKVKARFKAFSGQRCDWEPQFCFWRDLILNISRRFNLLFISPSHLKHRCFNRSALTPLCLDNLEMYRSGDLLRITDLEDPKTGRLSQLFKKMMRLRPSPPTDVLNDRLILLTTLQEKAAQVVESLSQSHCTSSCIITMKQFQSLFLEQHEAYAVFSYLSAHGTAKYIAIKNKQLIEGVKFSLSSTPISVIPNVDYDTLQLIWTAEALQQQLHVIDKQYERSRQFALAALRSGDKNVALRNARQLKLASESREKLLSFLNRVEGVLHVVSDAKSTKMVSEAVQVGARAINEHSIEVEEVQSCLRKLDELMISQAEVNKALESYTEDDVDVEEELHELELQISDETLEVSTSTAKRNAVEDQAFTHSLSTAMAGLKLGPLNSSTSRVENELPS
ncbi:hypothetical protein RND81_13G219900 [Saponaria officinalis]|uniref:Charged multivesicular body protein 7 n=1 Tax=Saponaria officinalis TaxID=3572 RepID=A0AAW1H6U3_SAPOF